MALVSVQDLIDYMSDIHMTDAQKRSAEDIIDGVQSDLEMHINRAIETRAVREVVKTDGLGFAYLSQTPVWEIRGLSQIGFSSVPPPLGTVPSTGILPFPEGRSYDMVPRNFGRDAIVPGGVMLGASQSYFIVDYLAGGGSYLAPYIPAIKKAILHVAARDFQHMHSDRMSITGNGRLGDDVDPSPSITKGWTDEELEKFDRIRRRVVL